VGELLPAVVADMLMDPGNHCVPDILTGGAPALLLHAALFLALHPGIAVQPKAGVARGGTGGGVLRGFT